jgi:hypothetical protein
MTTDEIDDPILRRVSQLPLLTPDPLRSERLRGRCRAKVARRRKPVRRAPAFVESCDRILAPAFVGALSVLYLSAIVYNALRVYGLL